MTFFFRGGPAQQGSGLPPNAADPKLCSGIAILGAMSGSVLKILGQILCASTCPAYAPALWDMSLSTIK